MKIPPTAVKRKCHTCEGKYHTAKRETEFTQTRWTYETLCQQPQSRMEAYLTFSWPWHSSMTLTFHMSKERSLNLLNFKTIKIGKDEKQTDNGTKDDLSISFQEQKKLSINTKKYLSAQTN